MFGLGQSVDGPRHSVAHDGEEETPVEAKARLTDRRDKIQNALDLLIACPDVDTIDYQDYMRVTGALALAVQGLDKTLSEL